MSLCGDGLLKRDGDGKGKNVMLLLFSLQPSSLWKTDSGLAQAVTVSSFLFLIYLVETNTCKEPFYKSSKLMSVGFNFTVV